MTVTIKEVARDASVSVATVSRVFNGKGPVRAETRRRVRQVAERLRYAPHGAARSLITRRTSTLGVLLPDLYGEFFSEVIRGIDGSARGFGYHLLVSSSHSDRGETEAMLRAMRGRVDGLIVLFPHVNPKTIRTNLPEKLPIVLLNCAGQAGSLDSISIDNYGGASAMVRHLIRLGHRRIAFIKGPPDNHDASERLRGYRETMRKLCGEGSEKLELPGDFREETGYRAGKRIVEMRARPSAVFAANDAMAIGLLCAFRERYVRVPEDIALAGFDDIPIAKFITPPLTTVRVPIPDLGSRAMARLLELLEATGERAPRSETVPTTLVVRSSCGASRVEAATPSGGMG